MFARSNRPWHSGATLLALATTLGSPHSEPGAQTATHEPCPSDMQLVEGLYCPSVSQQCLEFHEEYVRDPDTSERCMRFAEPSTCLSEQRVLMRYCVDRYEWPNHQGVKPTVLVTWEQARKACTDRGKRLCTEPEWTFACEGDQALPYTYGYVRDPTVCVFDRLYVERKKLLLDWAECLVTPDCRAEFERLDQREPAGRFRACRSPFGVMDMNGNVNEWILVSDAVAPYRSGLKGGWWGPVRDRCRPTVRFHDEYDRGYEVGFRCCADSRP